MCLNKRQYFVPMLISAFAAITFLAHAGDFPNPSADNLPPRTLLSAPEPVTIPQWLRTNLRVGHLPGYNERMVREYLKAGYNVITVNCLAAWDRVGPGAAIHTPEEVRNADTYLRTVVETIHTGGAKSIFYLGPVQAPLHDPTIRTAHPEWLRVRADGSRDENFGNIRSGYADWVRQQLAYLVETYHVDGFWFDGYAPVHLHTYDEATRDEFRKASGGKEIPTTFDPVNDPVAREYLAWHEQYFIELATKMRASIRQKNPEAVIFANYSANRTWYFPDAYMGEYPAAYCQAIDVPSVELYWDVPGDALYQQFCYAFMQGVCRQGPAAVWIQPSAHGISGVASPIDIQLRGLEGAPWGVYAEFVESTGREEYFKLHIDNVRRRDQFWTESEPVPYIGVVASEQTRTLFARGALPVYFSHTLGAFRSLFERHLPVQILTEYDLENGDMRGACVVVLPNVACLSDRASEVLRRFVAAGGGLVASYETSLYNESFQRRADFSLADVFHASYKRSHSVGSRSEALALTLGSPHPITSDPAIELKQATSWRGGLDAPPSHADLALIASAAEVAPADGAEVLATYRLPASASETRELPAVIASSFGKGRAVYFPASVDKAMFYYPDAYQRALLVNACRWAAGKQAPPLEVEGPLLLATTFRRQPRQKRHVVHLLNDHSSYGRHSIYQKLAALPEDVQKKWGFPNQSELRGTWPVREEIIPLHDIHVTCRISGIRKATLEPEHEDLPLEPIDGGVRVRVPKLLMHSMVVFE